MSILLAIMLAAPGRLMNPIGQAALHPPVTYYITTESGVAITTESSVRLVTENAP